MKTIFRMLWNGFLSIVCGIFLSVGCLCKLLGEGFTKAFDWFVDVGDKIYVKIYNEKTDEEWVPNVNEVVDT